MAVRRLALRNHLQINDLYPDLEIESAIQVPISVSDSDQDQEPGLG